MSETTETTQTTMPIETSQTSATGSALSSNLNELAKGKESTPISNAASTSTHEADKLGTGKDETGKDIPLTKTEEADYDLELPKDSSLTSEDLAEIVKIAEERGLNKVEAEKLITERESLLKKGYTKAEAKIAEKYKEEQKALLSHPDFVGENRTKSFESIQRAVSTFGDDKLVEALNRPDVGNNLALALFLKKIGDMIAPDSIGGKGNPLASGGNDTSKEEALKKLYPDFYKNS